MYPTYFRSHEKTPKIAGANAGDRLGFARKSRVVLSHRPGAVPALGDSRLLALNSRSLGSLFLSESLRSRRLCVWFFNAEAAEAAELRREFESGAP
jgi:hypothetical protein